eukprot:Gb_04477 [translate_table: standard]
MSSADLNNCSSNHDQACAAANKDSTSCSSVKRTWSTESLGSTRTCVCAPTTHAGSFRCRLHRMSSAQTQAAPLQPPPATPSMSASSTRTVEAQ